jgi:hydrogenase nickel incorporation protein HypB
MCDSCGCGDPEVVPVDVSTKILAENDRRAAHNGAHFEEAGVVAINLMGSPGAGKTALLEATARHAGHRLRITAVSGDLATDLDAARLRAAGIPSATITTGSACHLDARLVHDALHAVAWDHGDVFFIENVGNLVCPAIYDLGQAANVVVLSATEGVDKPLKYPVMFRRADLVILTKCDLLPHLPGVNPADIENALARVNPEPRLLRVSATTGEGIDEWVKWLAQRIAALTRAHDSVAHSPHHHHHHHHHHD